MTSAAHIIRRRRARQARQQTRQQRSRIWLGMLAAALLLFGLLPLGVAVGGALVMYRSAVRGLPLPEASLSQGLTLGLTEMYDRSGATLLLSDLSGSERQWLTLADLPAYVPQATLRAEDGNYLSNKPDSLITTFSRLWENTLFGSYTTDRTLTGRLVRGVIAPLPERPTSDDIGREIALEAEIEQRYTPEQILEWYLNTADYGNQSYGIQAAAQTYLGKDAADLTLDEAAMLAAIPLATQYNPLENETAARGRQRDLLRAMRTAGEIAAEDYDVAVTTQTPIMLTLNQPEQIAPEFVAYARRQAQDILDAQGRNGTAVGGTRRAEDHHHPRPRPVLPVRMYYPHPIGAAGGAEPQHRTPIMVNPALPPMTCRRAPHRWRAAPRTKRRWW